MNEDLLCVLRSILDQLKRIADALEKQNAGIDLNITADYLTAGELCCSNAGQAYDLDGRRRETGVTTSIVEV